jgi:hypothetical protein
VTVRTANEWTILGTFGVVVALQDGALFVPPDLRPAAVVDFNAGTGLGD